MKVTAMKALQNISSEETSEMQASNRQEVIGCKDFHKNTNNDPYKPL